MLAAQKQIKSVAYSFDAPVNAGAFTSDGAAYAFALGNGNIHIVHGGDRLTVKAHTGAVPRLKAYGDGFLSLSDDGTLKRVEVDGTLVDFADFKGAWTEQMDSHANGSVAVAVGNTVHLWTRPDGEPRILTPHEGGVNGVKFAADGMGLAAAHRNGVTLWAWPHFEPQPLPLPWKGAHLGVTISDDKRWIVSAMQEGALHMWNTALKRDYQMRGYAAKPTAMVWSADRKWLATSGADAVIIWPFDKSGPEGREPLQLGWAGGVLVTVLAAHPTLNVIAAGFADGTIALLDIASGKSFSAATGSGSAVTTLAFSPAGDSLLAGFANARGSVFNLM